MSIQAHTVRLRMFSLMTVIVRRPLLVCDICDPNPESIESKNGEMKNEQTDPTVSAADLLAPAMHNTPASMRSFPIPVSFRDLFCVVFILDPLHFSFISV